RGLEPPPGSPMRGMSGVASKPGASTPPRGLGLPVADAPRPVAERAPSRASSGALPAASQLPRWGAPAAPKPPPGIGLAVSTAARNSGPMPAAGRLSGPLPTAARADAGGEQQRSSEPEPATRAAPLAPAP